MKFLRNLLVLLLCSCQLAWSQKQKWRPDFQVITLSTSDLPGYLARGIEYNTELNLCKSEVGYFYFRVTGRNRVDSVRYEGSLRPSLVDLITRHIYGTENRWKMPAGTNDDDTCWFIYPFFIFGAKQSCSKEDKLLYESLETTSLLLARMGKFAETESGFLIVPKRCYPFVYDRK